MSELVHPKIISGNSNITLSKGIASWASSLSRSQIDLVEGRVEQFNDQEIFVEVFENVRNEDMFIIQSTSNPANDNIMELLIIADALRRSSAKRITAVIPYFGYARQDRRTKARTPISAKLIANLLSGAGIERILTLDLHSAQIQGFFDIPVDNLYASPIFELDISHYFERQELLTVVSPDVGGVVRSRALAKYLDGLDLAIIDKRRDVANESEVMNIIGDVAGKECIVPDDIIDTAGTLCNAAKALKDAGASKVSAYITHPVLSGPAIERISNSEIDELVVTNSIPLTQDGQKCSKIRVISIAPIISECIKRLSNDESLSAVFL